MIKFVVYAGIGAIGYAFATGDLTVSDFVSMYNTVVPYAVSASDMAVSAYDFSVPYVVSAFDSVVTVTSDNATSQ